MFDCFVVLLLVRRVLFVVDMNSFALLVCCELHADLFAFGWFVRA